MHEEDVAKSAERVQAELAQLNPNIRVDLVLGKKYSFSCDLLGKLSFIWRQFSCVVLAPTLLHDYVYTLHYVLLKQLAGDDMQSRISFNKNQLPVLLDCMGFKIQLESKKLSIYSSIVALLF